MKKCIVRLSCRNRRECARGRRVCFILFPHVVVVVVDHARERCGDDRNVSTANVVSHVWEM